MKSLIFALTTRIICLMTGVFILVSCTPNTTESIQRLADENAEPSKTSTKQDIRIPISESLNWDEIIAAAQEHLADELDVSPKSVILLGTESAEWNDLELGCSKPSPKYQNRALQRSLPGLRILLSVHGKTYEYHSNTEWMVFCGISKSSLHEKILLPPTLTN